MKFLSINFCQSAFFLALSLLIIKAIGFLYVIPFVAIVGESGYLLYDYAHKSYSLVIMLVALGVPGAYSKFISQNGEDKNKIIYVFHSSFWLMLGCGLVSFLVLYFSAPYMSLLLIGEEAGGNSLVSVEKTIKSISFSLLFIPILFFFKGFEQGYQNFKIISISQVIEQIIRVAFVLISVLIGVKILEKEMDVVIEFSLMGVLLSNLIALFIVGFYAIKRIDRMKKDHTNSLSFSKNKVKIELLGYIIPFALPGVAITLSQTVDTFMINRVLVLKGYSLYEAETINAVVSLVQKVSMIPVVIATAFSIAAIPIISRMYKGNKIELIREEITKILKAILFFTFPAAVGLIILGKSIYATIFGVELHYMGGDLLSWYAVVCLLFALYSFSNAILLSINQTKWVIVSLAVGLSVKLFSNYSFILLFDGFGTVFSTMLSFSIIVIIQMSVIQGNAKYNWLENIYSAKTTFVNSILMGFLIAPFGLLSLSIENYWLHLIITVTAVLIGGILYFWFSYKSGTIKILSEMMNNNHINK